MTQPSTVFRKDYTGNNATTEWAYNWKIYADTQLKVTRVTIATGAEVTLTVNVDYTVTGVGNTNGGNVVIDPALADTYNLIITPNFPQEQDIDFTNQAAVPPERVEEGMDKIVGQIKQQQNDISLSLKGAKGLGTSYVYEITEAPADGYALVWDGVTGAVRNSTITIAGLEAYAASLDDLTDEIVALAALDTEIGALGALTTEITALGALDTEIGALGALTTEITALGAITSAISTVSTNIANVNTVGTNIATVNAVAAALAASVASGISFDDTGLDFATGDDVQEAIESLDTLLAMLKQEANAAPASGTVTCDMALGCFRQITPTGSFTLDITPRSGYPGFYYVRLVISSGPFTVTLTGFDDWDGGAAPDFSADGTYLVCAVADSSGNVTGKLVAEGIA